MGSVQNWLYEADLVSRKLLQLADACSSVSNVPRKCLVINYSAVVLQADF
jgi:hypothetical protein